MAVIVRGRRCDLRREEEAEFPRLSSDARIRGHYGLLPSSHLVELHLSRLLSFARWDRGGNDAGRGRCVMKRGRGWWVCGLYIAHVLFRVIGSWG